VGQQGKTLCSVFGTHNFSLLELTLIDLRAWLCDLRKLWDSGVTAELLKNSMQNAPNTIILSSKIKYFWGGDTALSPDPIPIGDEDTPLPNPTPRHLDPSCIK